MGFTVSLQLNPCLLTRVPVDSVSPGLSGAQCAVGKFCIYQQQTPTAHLIPHTLHLNQHSSLSTPVTLYIMGLLESINQALQFGICMATIPHHITQQHTTHHSTAHLIHGQV
jgi:hypothetical protein